MADKYYVGDIGTEVILDVGSDISGASSTMVKVLKPDGTQVEWTAEVYTIDGLTQYLRYVTISGDLSIAGKYHVQAYLSLSGWTGLGETATFMVYEPFD